jgi:hypothetical protein
VKIRQFGRASAAALSLKPHWLSSPPDEPLHHPDTTANISTAERNFKGRRGKVHTQGHKAMFYTETAFGATGVLQCAQKCLFNSKTGSPRTSSTTWNAPLQLVCCTSASLYTASRSFIDVGLPSSNAMWTVGIQAYQRFGGTHCLYL